MVIFSDQEKADAASGQNTTLSDLIIQCWPILSDQAHRRGMKL
jgi:hypothetical protein